MRSRPNEPDLARVLARAVHDCPSGQPVWLGSGLPQELADRVPSRPEKSEASLGFIEVDVVSCSGVARLDPPASNATSLVGLSALGIDTLSSLIVADSVTGVPITRLICSFAVFEFCPNGPVVREVQRGLTAADLQARLDFPLWAGPDLKEFAGV